MVEIWVDGSCRGNPGPGGWGAIVLKDNIMTYVIQRTDPQTTNNRMEMSAIIWALENYGDKEQPVVIYSDSAYCINTFNTWMWNWKKQGWKRSKGQSIENLDLVLKYNSLKEKGLTALLKKVNGHSGVKYNELADKLAKGEVKVDDVIRREFDGDR